MITYCGTALEQHHGKSGVVFLRLYRADYKYGEHGQNQVDGAQGHRLFDKRQVHAAFAYGYISFAAHGRIQSEQHDHYRGDFYTARGRAAVTADKHKNIH